VPSAHVLDVHSYGSAHETTLARSSPAIDGAPRARASASATSGVGEALGSRNAAVLCALLAQKAREAARVEVRDRDDVAGAQPVRQVVGAPPARRQRGHIAYDEPAA
jgi:hypothetical protein